MKKIMMVSIFVGLLLTGASANGIVVDEFGCNENTKNIQELERVIKQGTEFWSLEQLRDFRIQLKSALKARKNHICG